MALKSQSKFRLGAVLARRRKVISTGFNQMNKTHPMQQKYCNSDITLGLHAEIHCCIGVSAKDLLGADMWVCRIYRNGTFAIAKPCKVCEKFLTNVGINKVYYTTGQGDEVCSLVF